MKGKIMLSLLISVISLAVPVFSGLMHPMVQAGALREAETEYDSGLYYSPAPPVTSGRDGEVSVRVLSGGEVTEMTVGEYLLGAVAAEMPASFHPEALKAQAVALRTYLLRKTVSPTHDNADICTDSGCCAAWCSEAESRERWGDDYALYAGRIRDAVSGTDGEYLTYGGEPALAVFHSSSAGATEDCSEVWGEALPYLVSVKSPETEADVPGYVTEAVFSLGEFRDAVLASHPEADLSGEPSGWMTDPVTNGSGRLESLTVGGVTISGTEVRKLFSLRSTAVTVSLSVSPDGTGEVTFTSTGSGHGVGMSQYGANVMAEDGAGYEDILAAYYPGTALTAAS